MGRNENIAIFKDTEKLCRTNRRIKESLENSIKLQVITKIRRWLYIILRQHPIRVAE